MIVIDSPQSARVKALLPARRKKGGVAYLEGERSVREALTGQWRCESLLLEKEYAGSKAGRDLSTKALERGTEVLAVHKRPLAKISGCQTPPPVGVVIAPPDLALEQHPHLPPRLLVLDGLSDPGNVGTLIRAGAAFGFSAVLTAGSVRPENEKMLRSSAGVALHREALFTAGPAEELGLHLAGRGYSLYILEADAEQSLWDVDFRAQGQLSLVLGAEAAGLNPGDWPLAKRVGIPIGAAVESLNVAMAGAVALYEIARQTQEATR